MDLLNFALEGDGITVRWQDQYLDLHNCFNFQSLQYNLPDRSLELHWLRSPEPWAASVALPGFKLLIKNVTFFRVKERDPKYSFTEDDCLCSLSFHSPELRDEFDSISLASATGDDLTFFFQSEWGLKVNGESAELIPATDFRA